ncbi:recombinase family protein [Paracoccus sp. PS-1]|uniref:recombinase family protein n=1 Tax=unclassified Paracoccus (in: a-proteobacteria) TaxID=2688777 RepID=UPI00048C5FE6|nr:MULTISPECIES: recombinase family protein [unclassified Paracoccus (in: a-proteobacteria)]MDQ7262130.1 recombinase family protein [Paracoccus sp. PS1]
MSQTILYARVSTTEQTLDHQRTQAEAVGFRIDHVVADHGASGVSTRLAEREGGRRLFDMLRAGDVLVVRWLDRLGRDYLDVRDTVQEFMRRGVTVHTVINKLTFDGATTDPVRQGSQGALLSFMAGMASAQAEATREAQRAGIAHAKATRGEQAYRGRKPSYSRAAFEAGRMSLDAGASVAATAAVLGLSRQTVHRFKTEPEKCRAALDRWGM